MVAKKKSETSGAGRIRKAQRSLIWVTPNEEEKKRIRQVAGALDQSMSQFVLEAALTRADKYLENNSE